MDRDREMPNEASKKSKAEGERWRSEPDTVEQRNDDDRTMGRADEGAGASNRPLGEEVANQQRVPERGESTEGAHAGHGDRDRKSYYEE